MDLKLITEKDLEWARRQRNNNREYFINQEIITKKAQQEWFKNHNGNFYIIWIDGKRAGTVSVNGNEIGNILLLPEYRGQGILRRVMSLFDVDTLEVKADNKRAIKAYLKLGFKIFSHKMIK